MTVMEIIERAAEILDAPDVFATDEYLNLVLEGYVDLCRETECLTTAETKVISALEPLFNAPEDHLRSVQIRWGDKTRLRIRTSEYLDDEYGAWAFDVGTPSNVTWSNYNALRLVPNPGAAGTINHRYAYYPKAIQLTDEPEIQRVFHQALVDYVVHAAALILRSYDIAMERWGSYSRMRSKLKAESNRKSPKVMWTEAPVTTHDEVRR